MTATTTGPQRERRLLDALADRGTLTYPEAWALFPDAEWYLVTKALGRLRDRGKVTLGLHGAALPGTEPPTLPARRTPTPTIPDWWP